MPLYEIVLSYPDCDDEVRLTDTSVAVGDRLEIAGDAWEVTLKRSPRDACATARFLCELAREQRERDARVRAWQDELQARLAPSRERMTDAT